MAAENNIVPFQSLGSRLSLQVDQWLIANRAISFANAPDTLRLEAVASVIRELAAEKMCATEQRYEAASAKRVYYLSMEFLMGRALGNNALNLGMRNAVSDAMTQLGDDLESLSELEADAALGNGGLGRLAACFLDSMATLGIAGYGYGINYEFGLFRQIIDSGQQFERPDQWQAAGSPWLIPRNDQALLIPAYGHIEHDVDRNGDYNPMWSNWQLIVGVPHDMPIIGWGGETVNVLRLFAARASDDFDVDMFNEGDYIAAVQQKITTETISKVLYPSDSVPAGKELRLLQEYFLVACSVRDIFRRFGRTHTAISSLPDHAAIQLNDTHPALTVAELMRVLVDEHGLPWDEAWRITNRTIAYTNHTLLPEALEKWPIELMERVIPRHTQIIREIDRRHRELVELFYPSDTGRKNGMAIIDDHSGQVRMANLAIVGSHSVNGVAQLHSDLVKSDLVPDFYRMTPAKFNNKTNGVTPRRWLAHANPELASLITHAIGDAWITNLDRLRDLERYAEDAMFLNRMSAVKARNKTRLAGITRDLTGLRVDPSSLFDVQIKRIHEYKRQLLNVLQILDRYREIVEEGLYPQMPRTFFFAGKAAPGYWMAKQIIRLINDVSAMIERNPKTSEWIRVVFLPDYRVSLAERIIPAAELSEQISTAGKEASGTGNMKLALNGALTIGTWDGANIEIAEEVGMENIFIFGHRTEAVRELLDHGQYRPWEIARNDAAIGRVVEMLIDGSIVAGDRERYRAIYDKLVSPNDEYIHLGDLRAYIQAQHEVDLCAQDSAQWNRKSLLNIARIGKFSSDRTILEYAREIWDVSPVTGLESSDTPVKSARG
ncbi:MAG TPA: glycogen/starch/alpha-glucan phosphorylase [Thermoanaerobaculia bacterium]|nr:glycogen/starch/alpha-glucan phosphorylase [Thermoanaerobaculia bacterium]